MLVLRRTSWRLWLLVLLLAAQYNAMAEFKVSQVGAQFMEQTLNLNATLELGLSDKVLFPRPYTVLLHNSKWYPFDSILKALLFPGLGFGLNKIRFGLVGLYLRLTFQPIFSDGFSRCRLFRDSQLKAFKKKAPVLRKLLRRCFPLLIPGINIFSIPGGGEIHDGHTCDSLPN